MGLESQRTWVVISKREKASSGHAEDTLMRRQFVDPGVWLMAAINPKSISGATKRAAR